MGFRLTKTMQKMYKKIENKERNYQKLSITMHEMAAEAQKNGLTEDILNDILKNG
jgi:esterase/lipase